jgi:hypothetical protein
MHAVMLSVTFDDVEASGRDLERRVPRLQQLPGFVAVASFIEQGTATDPGETWERVEVGEVIAQG